jgi:hypothetical protein
MAKIKQEAIKEVSGNEEVSKNLLGALLKGYKETHFNFDQEPQKIIPSGSLKLDMFVKVKSGTTIRIGGPQEVGKAQPLWSNVLTPTGWSPIGSLKQGDLVVGSDGQSRQILYIIPQGKLKVNKVTFSDKTNVFCCDEHLWFTKDSNDRNNEKRGCVKTTNQIKKTLLIGDKNSYYKYNHSIPYVKPVVFKKQQKDLPLDSYLLGLILGDGCFRKDKYRIGFTTADEETIERITHILPENVKVNKKRTTKYEYDLYGMNIVNILKNLGLYGKLSYDKFVPKNYLFNSIENRKSLLQGLLDTDGGLSRKNTGIIEYSSSSEQLANDVVFLVRSLGGRATISSRIPTFIYKGVKKDGHRNYRVRISFTDFCPFKLSRKVNIYKNRETETEKYIISIEDYSYEECVCIKVQHEDSLYITDGFNLTHNSSQSLLFAQNYMNTFPKSKTIYINTEAKFGSEIQDRTGLKYTMSADTWDYNSVFIFQTNDFNTIANTLKALLISMHEQGEHLCIIIDSVDMLKLTESNDKKIGENKRPAGVNWLTKEMFRQLGQEIQGYNAFLIMITQYAAVFKLDQYSPDAPHMMDGNNTHALNHLASYGFYYRQRSRTSLILENPEDKKPDPVKNKILGVIATVDIKKSASDDTGLTIEVPIKKGKTGNCVWVEKEIFDVCFMNSLIKQSGAWIEFSDVIKNMATEDKIDLKVKHQGIGQFSDYFEQNPEITKWIVNKLRDTIG